MFEELKISFAVRKGKEYLERCDFLNALDEFSFALKKDPHNLDIHMMRVMCFLGLSKFKEALKYIEEIFNSEELIIRNYYIELLFLRVDAYIGLEKYKDALNDLEIIFESEQNLKLAYQRRADVYKKMGKKEEYESDLSKYKSL